ncbi:hypothetical protein P5673_002633 [Acropora cervicornis]|uniref:Uncharacterized protein n=1 Tax=Acropora cervicornis TaxID=6130 RepID=A0AAD9R3Y5_ACRCE|nr:hypothetical protein P5673_002633 [Acropora cervicornis]
MVLGPDKVGSMKNNTSQKNALKASEVFIPQCKTKRMDVKYKQENSLQSYKITRTRVRFTVFKVIEADRTVMMA